MTMTDTGVRAARGRQATQRRGREMDATAPRDDEPSGTTREEEGIGAFNSEPENV